MFRIMSYVGGWWANSVRRQRIDDGVNMMALPALPGFGGEIDDARTRFANGRANLVGPSLFSHCGA